ncbi:MAG: trypsin-like peptidase domain-containing protein [Elusimicrobia bacterium]|nr:trypsin-like peptidase domain-containing protein [Elusimicrobiota bacterium]
MMTLLGREGRAGLLLALAAALGAATPARAQSGDEAFSAAFGAIRRAVLNESRSYRSDRGMFRLATQETGPNDPLLLAQKPMIDLIKRVEPSVVFLVMDIPAAAEHGAMAAPAPMPIPATPKKKGGQAICTGFFVDGSKWIDRKGLIATNSHCVEKLAVGAEISVGLYDGNDNRPKMTKGKVLAYGDSASAKDIALVELADHALDRRPLPLWWKLDVGEQVVAIGNPLGLTFSVSKGIISALERDNLHGQFVLDANQSDVAVNPGNSGGPLFNMWGSVVGINSMIASQSGGFEGISMSLPANYIAEAIKQYARTGDLKAGALQIVMGPDEGGKKLVVASVVADGPAAAAGLAAKDELVSLDGIDLTGLEPAAALKTVLAHLKYMSPGEKTKLVVSRAGQKVAMEATLGVPKAPEPPRPEWAPIPPKPKKSGFGVDPAAFVAL